MTILSSTPSVLAIKDLDFGRGILIPHAWFSQVLTKSGAPDMTAIILLSEIVYWHRLMPVYEKNELIGYKKKFEGNKLQKQTKDFAKKFGWSSKTINEALNRLVELQLITREFKDVHLENYVAQERQYIDIVPQNLIKITFEAEVVLTKCNDETFTPPKPFVYTPINKTFTPPKPFVEHTEITNTIDYSNTNPSFFTAPQGAVLETVEIFDLKKTYTDNICETPIESQSPNPPVAPAPLPQNTEVETIVELAPITIATLTVLAKDWGCNGKSENYAGEFYHYWDAKNWQINEKGSKMRNAEGYFKKFIEAKKPKEKEVHLAYQDCVKVFFEKHQELHGREYTKFEKKDGKAINDIIGKLEIEMKNKVKEKQGLDNTIPLQQIEIAPVEVANAFKFLLNAHKIQWVNDNFSPTNINSKFNDLINSIRETNGNNAKNKQSSTTNRPQSSEELAQRARDIMRAKGYNV